MIIKCPECGHQVSDKAPVCPSCGVEIAGHLIKCSNCGELYLKEEGMCPNCHHTETGHHDMGSASQEEPMQKPVEPTDSTEEQIPMEVVMTEPTDNEEAPQKENEDEEETVDADFIMDDNADEEVIAAAERVVKNHDDDEKQKQQKRSHSSLAISLLIAIITAGILLFLYNQGVNKNRTNVEQDAYAQAIGSNEPTVLQDYLENNPDAPKTHRDSISARLNSLQNDTQEWTSMMTSNSKEAYQEYLSKHPNTPHRKELLAKIDEIDWAAAVAKGSEDAFLGYKAQHPDGAHSKEADEKLKVLLVHTATEGDKSKAVSVLRQLLQGMNSKSSDKIAGAVASQLNFLGAGGATAKDIQKYMKDKLYQADVKTINWHLGSPAEVTKEGDNDEEMKVKVPATLDIDRQGGKSKRNYVISATIKGNRITQVNWR